MKLGEHLVRSGKITKEKLQQALVEQRQTGERLGQLLLRRGLISEKDLAPALGECAGVECVDLRTYPIDPSASELIPFSFARKHRILPLSLNNGSIQVAAANPLDIVTFDKIKVMTKRQVDVFSAAENEILSALEELYGQGREVEKGAREKAKGTLDKALQKAGRINVSKDGERLIDTSFIIEAVNEIILQAVKEEATDIHIEPEDDRLDVRYRIDGILHQFASMPKAMQSAVATRIKIMADLDISETRIPQDGRCEFPLEERKIDLRVSTFPAVYGENIVIRILDKERVIRGLNKLGFSRKIVAIYEKVINKQNGIILVTGPTGSGKTTTLYSTLMQLKKGEKNIMTLEDPVEYLLPQVRQSQVNPKAGLTFANGLRAILRQDPDVILVGEIRDRETMEMAIRAALTGHLVFSTLHTTNAPGAVARLLDMGTEPYLLASSLNAVLSQRLVRVVCRHCKEISNPDEKLLRDAGWNGEELTLYSGRGCDQCNYTGHRGRIGIFELLVVTPKIGKLIKERKDTQVIKEAAREEGMITLLEDGLLKVKQGITTLEEVFRVGAG